MCYPTNNNNNNDSDNNNNSGRRHGWPLTPGSILALHSLGVVTYLVFRADVVSYVDIRIVQNVFPLPQFIQKIFKRV